MKPATSRAPKGARNDLALRDACSQMHASLGRITALAEAAGNAMVELPRLPLRARRHLRQLEAFVYWTALAAREALDEADAMDRSR